MPEARGKNAAYEVRQKRAQTGRWSSAAVKLDMDGDKVSDAPGVV